MTTRTAPRNPLAALAPVNRRPYLTAVVFAVTLACGIAQLVHPPLYDAMNRDAARIDAGEW
jgi:hypothetical protein